MFTPLTTKLHIPAPRHQAVSRPRLTQRLTARPVALISAQAGSGKSTLLSEWAAQADRAVAWLSLDAEDNDPARFWSYLVAALQTVRGDLGQVLRQAANAGLPPDVQPLLIDLLNSLAAAPPIGLVLDDYHLITTPAIHDALRFFLDRLPGNVRVVIATRVDPPLPLARWRVRDQLTELRGADLQFTPDEAAHFLRETMGLNLPPDAAHTLTARTEGWIAGLQLAALSLHDTPDAQRFIAALAGTHHHILDYLVEEVLSAQPETIQHFLLNTAILNRMSAPICDVLMDQAGAGGSAEILIKLDKANLFLIPLDAERRWYRYHHLFAELLRARLNSLRPTAATELHLKAAHWFEQTGALDEAIGYALAARAFDRAGDLIEQAWSPALYSGQVMTVLNWLDALPAEVMRNRPLLNVAYGWSMVLRGQHAAAEPRLQAAEAALNQPLAAGALLPSDRLVRRTQAEAACLRSLAARARGESAQARAYAEQAITLSPDDAPLLRGSAWLVLGQVYFDLGQVEQALAAYRDALPLVLEGRHFVAVSLAKAYTGLAHRLQGRLRAAAVACREGLQLAAELGFEQLPAISVIEVTLATILYEWNELDEAERYAAHAYELGQRGGYAEGQRVGGALLAKIKLARGQVAAAGELLASIAAMPRSGAAAGIALLLDAQVRWRLARNEPTEAVQLAEALNQQVQRASVIARTGAALIAARAKLANGRQPEALDNLTACALTLEEHQLWGALIEALVLRAQAGATLGQPDRAVADLRRALSLAEPEGYLRIFLDEGEAVQMLLHRMKTEGGRLKTYVEKIIASHPQAESVSASLDLSAFSPQPLAEPLTERELDVLRLMADGYANPEIAARLVVAESTVKKHINHLFDKLAVQTRVQAVNKARELGLL